MKRRYTYIIWTMICMLIIVTGCQAIGTIGDGISAETSKASETEKESLTVWSYSDFPSTEIEKFEEIYNVNVDFTLYDDSGFTQMVTNMAVSQEDTDMLPDVVIYDEDGLENSDFVDILKDLSSISQDKEWAESLSPYVFYQGKNDSGKLIGLTYQLNPTGIFYRKDLAREYLGSDDPTSVQAYFTSQDTMSQLGETLKEDDVFLFPDLYGLRHLIDPSVSWLDDEGQLSVDSSRWDFLNWINSMRMNNYTASETEWSDDWLAGLAGLATDDAGETEDIFAYILPGWSISNIMMLVGDEDQEINLDENGTSETSDQLSQEENLSIDTTTDSSETSLSVTNHNPLFGEWGIVQAPVTNNWGGSWMSILDTSDQEDLAADFIDYMAADDEHVSDWLGNSYFTAADETARETQNYVLGSDFLGGQDYSKTMDTLAQAMEDSRLERSQPQMQEEMDEAFSALIIDYLQEDYHTVDEAIETLTANLQEEFFTPAEETQTTTEGAVTAN